MFIMITSLILSALVIIIDQITKATIYGMNMSLIGDFLWIESTFNKGASFGMMQDGTIFFIIVSIPVIIAMFYVIFSKKYLNKFNKICIGLVLGGTIGNLIDRIFLGGVRDFIYFKSINFAIFNVADIAITIGVIMFIIGLIVQILRKDKKAPEPKVQPPSENSDKLDTLKGIRDELKKKNDDSEGDK